MRRSSLNANYRIPAPPQGYNPTPIDPRLTPGGFVKIQAFAKINLFLDVLNRRADGYHNIVSVMQSVGLCDNITIAKSAGETRVICENLDIPQEDNLVFKAVSALREKFGFKENFDIILEKIIPVGAGLAGGSADCAAVLQGVNALANLGATPAELKEIGQSLGADVPFCLMGGTALTEGIGEIITPLPPIPPCYIVIANPGIHIATGGIFQKLDKKRPCVKADAMTDAIKSQNLPKIAQNLYNVFTPTVTALYPQIADLISLLRDNGAMGAEMTGTGSSVFAIFDNKNSAEKALKIIKKQSQTAFITYLGRNESI